MLLEALSNACGPSGYEGPIRQLLIPAVKDHVDEVQVDTMGNVYATKRATGETDFTVMVTAHMDEVGFLITKITSDGMLKFDPVGGFDPRILPGKSLLVGKDNIPGVIGLEAIHHVPREQMYKAPGLEAMVIDIGATSKDSAAAKVAVGDYATFATRFEHLNPGDDPQQGVVKGKALDNRAGCAALVEILQERYPVNVVGVFTVQEEVGLRGAQVAAHRLDPDMAIVLECTTADDLPIDPKKPLGYPRMGEGPCLTLMDRSYIVDRRLVDFLTQVAEAQGIPYQYKKPGLGGTDAGAIHRSRSGIPSAIVAPAARYIHGPTSLMSLSDYQNGIHLVRAALNAADLSTILERAV